MTASEIASNWLQVVVQTAGVLVTIVFAVLAVIWGTNSLHLSTASKAAVSGLLLIASCLFLGAILKAMRSLGTIVLALDSNGNAVVKSQSSANQSRLLFEAGIILVLIASGVVTVLAAFGE